MPFPPHRIATGVIGSETSLRSLRFPTRQLPRKARNLALGWRWRLGWLIGTRVPAHYDDDLAETIRRVRRHTMTSAPRIAALCDSVEYLVRSKTEGAIVECGTWRGGSMMAAALTLLRLGEVDRDLYLFDTFAGMPPPGDGDVDSPFDGYSIHARARRARDGASSSWNRVSADAVKRRLVRTGYPPERIHLVEGMVEDTLPERAPSQVALLRLDTDWYASTRHELEQLYPRLTEGGVLIVDDYGHYEGARRAVDEYLAESGEELLLSRIDYTGRIAVKPPRADAR